MVMVKPALAYLDVIARDPRRVRRSGRGVPREWRVRDGEGRRAARLDRRRPRSRSSTCSRSSAPAPTSCSPTSLARSPSSFTKTREPLAGSSGPRPASPVASTRRCARSVRSAAIRSSSPAAHGACLVDTDGREYLDYVQSWGASILGHAHPAIVEAVQQRRGRRHVVRRADRRARSSSPKRSATRVPSVEKVRLVSSGTEAAMTAVRLARGATGRAKIVKFAGCYHGHADALLVAGRAAASRRSACPGSAGRHAGHGRRHDRRAVQRPRRARRGARRARRRHRGDPRRADRREHGPGAARRRIPRRRCASGARCHGALLVFDEVITGFRVGLGGAQAAVPASRPTSRSSARSSAAGSRSPRVGGRAAVMDELAPLGPVYQAGTLSGNPLATAAGLAALARARRRCVRRARSASPTRLADGLRDAFADAGRGRAGHAGVHARRRVLLADAPVAQLRRRARPPITSATRRFFHGAARPRRVLRAERLRDAVPEPGPHRRRHRPHDRSGRRERVAA